MRKFDNLYTRFGNPLSPKRIKKVFMDNYKYKLDKKKESFNQLTIRATWDDLASHIKQLEKAKKPYYIQKHRGGKISIWTERTVIG